MGHCRLDLRKEILLGEADSMPQDKSIKTPFEGMANVRINNIVG